jgi:capsular exopolysaccharide synthesis family protein
MDTHDAPQPALPEPSLPARLPVLRRSVLGPPPSQAVADAPPPLTIQMAVRGVLRHWWQILAIWSVVSVALLSVIYVKIKPSYESFSVLRVEPNQSALFVGGSQGEAFGPYLETQVQLITSSNVLLAAANDPEVAKLSRIQQAQDAESEIRTAIQAAIVPGTYLIRVSMKSKSPTEAATIVNAVVHAYLKEALVWSSTVTKRQIDKLDDYLNGLESESHKKEKEWKELVNKGTVDPLMGVISSHDSENASEDREGDHSSSSRHISITLDEYRKVRDQLVKVNVELIQAEAILAMQQLEADGAPTTEETRLKARVEEAFRADPEVAPLYAQIEKLEEKRKQIERTLRNPAGDPSVTRIKQQKATLTTKVNQHWEAKEPMLRERLANQTDRSGMAEAMARVNSLKAQKAGLEILQSKIQVAKQREGSDVVDLALIREALDGLREMKSAVRKRLEQLNFDSKSEARISQINEARAIGIPLGDSRKKYMAVAPVGVMVALLGLFVLLEVKSGRVGTPDELSARTHLEVYGLPVMPGSPAARSIRLRSREEQLSVFVQSLDHLRVALFGEAVAGSCHCVTITSAIGGEGKTTLTAQLAARCATAGLSTLVIDADLRRASLTRMLEVTGAPGLADVLKGEITAEEALVPVQAGGFHLLAAGTRDPDPGRILQTQGLEQMLMQLRETFDIVLIDTPPVLPVPDALILGRLTDGAVLAARNTASRSQLVERTNRRLAAAGIPVLGVVLSGVEVQSLYYGSYAYHQETA